MTAPPPGPRRASLRAVTALVAAFAVLLAGAVGAEPPRPSHDADEVRRLADEIVGRREFAEPGRSAVQRALEAVGRWIQRVLGLDREQPELDVGTGGPGSGGSSGLTILLLVAAVVAVVLVLRATRGGWSRRRRVAVDDVDTDLEVRRSAEQWDDLARRLEAEGRWKDAMRARFGSLVERLADVGVVADVPGRTSGEYRVDVRGTLPGAADDFAEAADLFERAWYGDLPTGPEEADRFAGDAVRVLDAAGARR